MGFAVTFRGTRAGGQGGKYFLPGEYIAKIAGMKVVEKRKGGDIIFVECIICTSSNPEILVGERRTYSLNLNGDTEGILLSTIAAINGQEPPSDELEDEEAAAFKELFDDNLENGSAVDRFVEIEAHMGTSKNGVNMCFVQFHPIEDDAAQAELLKEFPKNKKDWANLPSNAQILEAKRLEKESAAARAQVATEESA